MLLGDKMKLNHSMVDVIKGYTKATCVAVVVMAAAELDLDSDADWERLRPLLGFLDKAWLLPCHAARPSWLHVLGEFGQQWFIR